MNKLQAEIKNLREKRTKYLDIYEKYWDKKTLTYSIDEPKEIDEISTKIFNLLYEQHDDLPIDFIVEELTHLGQAPCILYDDNGHFAVSGDGVQNTVFELSDLTITHFVEKDMWKPTIREALEYYLKSE